MGSGVAEANREVFPRRRPDSVTSVIGLGSNYLVRLPTHPSIEKVADQAGDPLNSEGDNVSNSESVAISSQVSCEHAMVPPRQRAESRTGTTLVFYRINDSVDGTDRVRSIRDKSNTHKHHHERCVLVSTVSSLYSHSHAADGGMMPS